MKNLLLLYISVFIFSCKTNIATPRLFKAELDTAYNNGTNIQSIGTDSGKIKTLTNLGMLWGFIKYYHPAVGKGDYNMDAELFRVLPKILSAKTSDEASKLMEMWVDHFGKPDSCSSCSEQIKNIKIKTMPDYGTLFQENNLPESLKNKLKYIKNNRYGKGKHYYIDAPYNGQPRFKHELIYANSKAPDAGLRLLALYRYWNMIQYFYPYRTLIGEDWNNILQEFIPVFTKADNGLSYGRACLQLISKIHDTHATLARGSDTLEQIKGKYFSAFQAAFVEKKLVVTGYYDDSVSVMYQLHTGDIIEKIDGVSVDSLIEKFLPLTPASNYTRQLYNLAQSNGFLLKGNTPQLNLQINSNGAIFNVTVPRSLNDNSRAYRPGNQFGFKAVAGNLPYVYAATIQSTDLDSIKAKFKNPKGMIIDLRSYPYEFFAYSFSEWLKPVVSPFVVTYGINLNLPGMVQMKDTISNGSDTGPHFSGKLVIIVNTETISRAEFTAMAFSTVPGAVVIGDTTAGADGDISSIILPGNIDTWFSGLGILYPDGTETERRGIKIDKYVRPTIEGIKNRRDELLDYAISIINSN